MERVKERETMREIERENVILRNMWTWVRKRDRVSTEVGEMIERERKSKRETDRETERDRDRQRDGETERLRV